MVAEPGGLLSPLSALENPDFRRLFAGRTLALVGSGLTTIALALLAYDLAGERAGFVLGGALALKMIAYVLIAPIVGGFVDRWPRRALLVALDLARAALVLALVAASTAGDIYLVIFLISACSAAFTPIYQAAIPELLQDSAEYMKGLVLSRVSFDLEGLLSPALSTLALLVIGYPLFFVLNALAFTASAFLIGTTSFPMATRSERPTSIRFNLSFGIRSYLATPRLRGLLAFSAAVSMAGAMIIVNTVVVVRSRLSGSETDVALAFVAVGTGSLLTALATPTILQHVSLRSTMIAGAALLPVALGGGALATDLAGLAVAWFVAGAGMSLIQTPAGRVIDMSCHPTDRAAFFSAQFALSHAAWLFAYPLVGWTGAMLNLTTAFVISLVGALVAVFAGIRLWPRNQPDALWHVHEAIEHDHIHGADEHHVHTHPSSMHDDTNQSRAHVHSHRHERIEHSHRFVIDAHHPVWPR